MNSAALFRLKHEIDSPRPLTAFAGSVTLTGWCFLEGENEPPPVRVVTEAGTLTLTNRKDRVDVAAMFPSEPAAKTCSFVIEGILPPGVHQIQFEACYPDGTWHAFKALSLSLKQPPFAAALDTPINHGTLRDRVRVGGWALHPDGPMVELSLRYGHRELPCRLGLVRDDVSAMFPHISHAGNSGFESSDFLWAGHGPVRLRGRLANGQTVIASTEVTFSVDRDENHDPDLELTAPRITLPRRSGGTTAEKHKPVDRPLNICFILPGSFAANSALHVAALANEFVAMGHECIVAVSHDLETLSHHSSPAFRGLLHQDAEARLPFANNRGPDIIHAWTTRENVRRLTLKLKERYQTRCIVHLEDNEREVLAVSLGRSASELDKLSSSELDKLVPEDLSHPHHGKEFLNAADGITIITDRLSELVPTGKRCHRIWPAADARYYFAQPRPDDFRSIINRSANETFIFYHGNVHASNAAEVRSLYEAVLQLNQAGDPVTLLRTGQDKVPFLEDIREQVTPYVLELGHILHHRHLPPLMALADIFVQPGEPDDFNDYRFPSKLPEFFALGRPVVLPRTNLGAALRHGIDAYVLDRADASGIAQAITELRNDHPLYTTLCSGALAYAKAHFNWRRSAERLASFYADLTTS